MNIIPAISIEEADMELIAETAECLGAKRRAVEEAATGMDDRLPFYRAMETPGPMARRVQ